MWYSGRLSFPRIRAWPIGKKKKSFYVCLKKLLRTYNKSSFQGICLKPIYKLWLKPTSQEFLGRIPKITLQDLLDLSVLPNLLDLLDLSRILVLQKILETFWFWKILANKFWKVNIPTTIETWFLCY
jgi:hypothetical protein